jgi:hypothetical protein
MRKIVEYSTILSLKHSYIGHNLQELDSLVTEAIAAGWQPLGVVIICDGNKVVQTMVKYDNEIL